MVEAMSNITSYLCAHYDSFFDSEKKIATYILNNYRDVVHMKLVDLAAASGASEASVSRFCRKIGVDGFHHLKISLAKEIVETTDQNISVSNHISMDDMQQSLQNIVSNKINEMKDMIQLIDEKEFNTIIQTINNARLVQFVAASNTIPVALDGAYKLNQIGIPAVSGSILDTQVGFTFNLGIEDVVIIISNSGETKDLVTTIKTANKVGATTISITNNPQSTIAKLSKFHLTTTTREKVFLDGYCFSRVSATMMIELIYLFCTSLRKDATIHIAQHEESIAKGKL